MSKTSFNKKSLLRRHDDPLVAARRSSCGDTKILRSRSWASRRATFTAEYAEGVLGKRHHPFQEQGCHVQRLPVNVTVCSRAKKPGWARHAAFSIHRTVGAGLAHTISDVRADILQRCPACWALAAVLTVHTVGVTANHAPMALRCARDVLVMSKLARSACRLCML